MRIRTLIQEVAASWTEYRKKGRVNKKSPPFFDRQIEIPYGCQRAARLADRDGKKRTTPPGCLYCPRTTGPLFAINFYQLC